MPLSPLRTMTTKHKQFAALQVTRRAKRRNKRGVLVAGDTGLWRTASQLCRKSRYHRSSCQAFPSSPRLSDLASQADADRAVSGMKTILRSRQPRTATGTEVSSAQLSPPSRFWLLCDSGFSAAATFDRLARASNPFKRRAIRSFRLRRPATRFLTPLVELLPIIRRDLPCPRLLPLREHSFHVEIGFRVVLI